MSFMKGAVSALAVALVLAGGRVAQAAQFNVTVGGTSGLKFEPEFVNAVVGDTILFTFKQKNHTATQSSFDKPCSPINGGFDSGFVPVGAEIVDGPFPAAELTVIDSNPVWVFCAQGSHCNAGMVFAINPADKFAAFKATAMGNTNSTTPSPSSSSASVNATMSASSSASTASSSASLSASSTASSITSSAASSAASSASSSASFSSAASSSDSTLPSASASSAPASSTDSLPANSAPSASSVSGVPPPSSEEPLPGPSSSAPSSTSSASPPTSTSTDHHVVVGGPGLLAFSPPNVKAEPGDTITFQFRQTNHTVTASSFDAPCAPLAGAFDSGFMAVPVDAMTFSTYTIQVNDTAPIWAFCRQGNHCASGMVFAVNAPVSDSVANNFDAFLAKAKGSKGSGSGGSPSNASASRSIGRRSSGAGAAVLVALVALLMF